MSSYQLEILQLVILLIILYLVIQPKFKRIALLTRRAFSITVYNFSKLIPKQKNLIVFGGENGQGFRGNTKYIFLEMAKDENLRCVWIAKNSAVVKQIRELGFESYHCSSRKGQWLQLRAKIVIHSHSINDDFNKSLLGGAISYLTWHGVGLKKVWGANKSTFSYKILNEATGLNKFFGKMVVKTNQAKLNYVVSTSERVSSYYPETFLVPKENVIEMGQVRNDVFFKTTEEDLEIPEWIRNDKIILYMPTHRKFGKLETDINLIINFPKLDEFCERHGYKFVVKRHMYSNGEVPSIYKNIIDISGETYDPQLLLKYTDILLTDYSSCYTDYLLLNRPVLFFCYDLELYLQKSNEMYFNYFDVTPGPKSFNFEDLLKRLEITMENPQEYEKERERVLNIFYSKDNQREVLPKQLNFIYRELLGEKNIHINQNNSVSM
ncbi:CDP-glycerol glycerophosphotransferase family protein [Bacillus kwashiorkori]|uniref:CDP-glycerol glycerophosphotransferase family protein n=1 Tax=Bacillus kwashiorkori TaxID=1522318 RepID=UPI000780F740|nr:CDP-glycerol glycerophosphotransferase family protein [Bacillus kwashiorkori]